MPMPSAETSELIQRVFAALPGAEIGVGTGEWNDQE